VDSPPLDGTLSYARESRAPNTRRAYRADWADFTAWCQTQSRTALPASPETLVLYLSDRADTLKTATLQRRLTAIAQAHKAADLETPTTDRAVRRVMTGIRRQNGTAQEGKAPAVTREIRAMVDHLPPTLRGQRDRALLLLGFAGAFRRSELVSLDVGDLAWNEDGLTARLRRSKTDQEGAGRTVGIPYGSKPATCPVRAVRAWLAAAEITDGPLFRGVDPHNNLRRTRLSDKTVARVVKAAAEAAGFDPMHYASHSLRAGPSPPRPLRPASLSASSWRRPATRACPWSGSTSARARSLHRTPPLRLGCNSFPPPARKHHHTGMLW